MPRKTKSAAVASTSSAGTDEVAVNAVKCAVCDQKVVEGKDQALLCEGLCNGWFHRYCAGVSLANFESLSSSSTPSIV